MSSLGDLWNGNVEYYATKETRSGIRIKLPANSKLPGLLTKAMLQFGVSAACEIANVLAPPSRRYEALMLVFKHLSTESNVKLDPEDEAVLRAAAIGSGRALFKAGSIVKLQNLIAQSPPGFPASIARSVLRIPGASKHLWLSNLVELQKTADEILDPT